MAVAYVLSKKSNQSKLTPYHWALAAQRLRIGCVKPAAQCVASCATISSAFANQNARTRTSRRSTTSLRRRICTSWANHANEVHVHERAVSRFNATANSKHVMPVNERVLDRHIEGRQMSRRNDTPLVQNVLKAALVNRGHP